MPRAKANPPLYVSVNVSARQFADPRFVADVRKVVSASGLAPSALVLELAEASCCAETAASAPT